MILRKQAGSFKLTLKTPCLFISETSKNVFIPKKDMNRLIVFLQFLAKCKVAGIAKPRNNIRMLI